MIISFLLVRAIAQQELISYMRLPRLLDYLICNRNRVLQRVQDELASVDSVTGPQSVINIIMKLIIGGYDQVSNQPACTISSANPTQLCRRALRPASSVANLSNNKKYKDYSQS